MKQPIFIISKANLFEAWLTAKRTADKNGNGWDWGRNTQYDVLNELQKLPERIPGYCDIPPVVDLLEKLKCHYAFPGADRALQGILSAARPLREKLHEVEERLRQRTESRTTGYFQASYEGSAPLHPEWGYVIRLKKP